MKVCGKCYDDIATAMDGDSLVYHFLGEPVTELDCEFWAHKVNRQMGARA